MAYPNYRSGVRPSNGHATHSNSSPYGLSTPPSSHLHSSGIREGSETVLGHSSGRSSVSTDATWRAPTPGLSNPSLNAMSNVYGAYALSHTGSQSSIPTDPMWRAPTPGLPDTHTEHTSHSRHQQRDLFYSQNPGGNADHSRLNSWLASLPTSPDDNLLYPPFSPGLHAGSSSSFPSRSPSASSETGTHHYDEELFRKDGVAEKVKDNYYLCTLCSPRRRVSNKDRRSHNIENHPPNRGRKAKGKDVEKKDRIHYDSRKEGSRTKPFGY